MADPITDLSLQGILDDIGDLGVVNDSDNPVDWSKLKNVPQNVLHAQDPHAATHLPGSSDPLTGTFDISITGIAPVQSHASTHNQGGSDPISITEGQVVNLTSRIDSKVPLTSIGQPFGVASLDSSGLLPANQLPISAMEFKGTWNAASNSPSLADGSGNTGDVYSVVTGGTRNLGGGAQTFASGDWVIYANGVWSKVINSTAVSSVDGMVGAVTTTSTAAPQDITKSTASSGSATLAAKADHKHDVATAAPTALAVGDTGAEGSSASLARADHQHALSTATPSTLGVGNSPGSSTGVSRADHIHAHGAQTDGSLHAVATASTHGFLSASDKAKLDTVSSSATNTPLATVTSPDVDASSAAVGSSSTAARADHKHSISVGTPSTVGTSNSSGTSSALSRTDHVHAHGNQTDGSLHAVATQAVSGFMSTSDKAKLDGIASGSTNTPLSSTSPTTVTRSLAIAGSSSEAARVDHKHDISTAAPASLAAGNTNAEGTATSLSRSDHQHAVPAAAPVTIGVGNSAGTSTSLSRADHVHAHGAQTDGSLHAVGTQATPGFLSTSDKAKIDGIASGATNTPLTSSSPSAVTRSSAVVGSSSEAARADHKHDISTATPITQALGDSAAEGSATTVARSDHRHGMPLAIAQSQVTNLVADLSQKVSTGDSRLSDARTPLAHKTTHAQGGSDALTGTLTVDITGTAQVARRAYYAS